MSQILVNVETGSVQSCMISSICILFLVLCVHAKLAVGLWNILYILDINLVNMRQC